MDKFSADKPILVGNWKMSLGMASSKELAAELVLLAKEVKSSEIWIAPSAPCLATVSSSVKGSAVKLGAQNCHWEKSGAFTGEVSPEMLLELGCSFVIIGHSERRHQFNEDPHMIAKRCHGALKAGLTVILCVGELLADRESSRTEAVLKSQLSPCLKDLKPEYYKKLLLAYEPVWAIGTGKIADPKLITSAHLFLRKELPSPSIPILYGGSVTADNICSFVDLDNVSGALIGGASVSSEKFKALVSAVEHS